MMQCGGLAAVREKDDEVSEVVSKVKPQLEEQSGRKFELLDVIHYRTQVVAGKNYFAKVKAREVGGAEQIVHLRVWKTLSGALELSAYQLNLGAGDELKYFQ